MSLLTDFFNGQLPAYFLFIFILLKQFAELYTSAGFELAS